MANKKPMRPWVEVHLRKNSTPPTGFSDVDFHDYQLHGQAIPWADLHCVSDVWGMFQTIPPGFEEFIPRPIQFYDVLVLCRPIPGRGAIAHPLIVLPDSAAEHFVRPDEPVTRPKIFVEGVQTPAAGIILVGCQTHWSSRLTLTP